MNFNNWASLKKCDDLKTSNNLILLTEPKFSIGRAADCDLSFSDNKLLSSYHCFIERHDASNAWLVDNSTNGTFINYSNHVKKDVDDFC